MKKLVKLLGEAIPDFIDLLYGITSTWISYYMGFVALAGIFYLADLFPSEFLKNSYFVL